MDHISLKIGILGYWDIDKTKTHCTVIDVLLLLYNHLVLSHINYYLLVWGHNPFRITKL